MTWQLRWAEILGHHPTEVALVASVILSLSLTLALGATERVRPWLRSRFESRTILKGERYEAIYSKIDDALVLLAMALLAMFGGASLFLHLVDGLFDSSALPQWDQTFIDTVHHTVTPLELGFFSTITPLAGVYPPIFLGLLMGGFLLKRKHYALLTIWVGGLVGNALLSQGLKQIFSRARPVLESPFLVEENFSFPSGHAMTSILLYGLLAYICSREFFKYRPGHRHLMIWCITFLGVLIGTSRLVLGVHYPSDVLAGWSVAVVWLGLLVLAAETLRGRFGPLANLPLLRRWSRSRASADEGSSEVVDS